MCGGSGIRLYPVSTNDDPKQFHKIIDNLSPPFTVLINFDFDLPYIVDEKLFNLSIYFCNDEFPNAYNHSILLFYSKYLVKKYSGIERLLAEKSNLCFAISDTLKNKLKKYNRNVKLIFPGQEFISNTKLGDSVCKEDNKITVCFMGYIENDINFDYLIDILKDQNIYLLLIGPIGIRKISFIVKRKVNYIINHKKVKYIAFQEGNPLFSLLKDVDIFIMPFKDNRRNVEVCNCPNKTFQYLAAGKPIVVTGLPNFLKLPLGFAYIANSSIDFRKKIKLAFKENSKELEFARQEYAIKNHWNKKGEYIKRIIQKNIILNKQISKQKM